MSVTLAAKRAQFEKEREFARLIMAAPATERSDAYAYAYGELYRLFPDLQQDQAEEENRVVTTLAFMAPFLGAGDTVVEIGAGRCHLAIGLAGAVREVVALDVASLSVATRLPANLRHQVFDGLTVPLPDGSADVVVSDNVLEHLHPDDARRQVEEAFRILKPRGWLVLLTPNAANGPHDISTFFTPEPSGLHLKEYGSGELAALLGRAGFVQTRAYLGAKGIYRPIWPGAGTVLEAVGARLPRAVTRTQHLRWLLPNRFTARKPDA